MERLKQGLEQERAARMQAEEALRRVEATVEQRVFERTTALNQLFDAAPIGLCLLDKELRYVYINKVLADINGQPAAAHIRKPFRDLTPLVARRLEPVCRRGRSCIRQNSYFSG